MVGIFATRSLPIAVSVPPLPPVAERRVERTTSVNVPVLSGSATSKRLFSPRFKKTSSLFSSEKPTKVKVMV